MSKEDKGFELYLHGMWAFLKGDIELSERNFRNSLELIQSNFEKGLVLSALGRLYLHTSGASGLLGGVSETGGAIMNGDEEEAAIDLSVLEKAIESYKSAASCLSGSDAAWAKYNQALAMNLKAGSLDESNDSDEMTDLLLGAADVLASGRSLSPSLPKVYYCMYMHFGALVMLELHNLTHQSQYRDSAKEYCAAAVKAVTDNHLENGMRYILDFCFSF
jgi:hypothetical protein